MQPAIAPDQTRTCLICFRGANDAHHVLHRSQGGSDHDHNLIDLCRGCHQALHGEKGGGTWEIVEHSKDRFAVVDTKTGEVIREEWHRPASFRIEHILKDLENAGRVVRLNAMNRFKYLDPDEIRTVYHYLKELDTENWTALARLLLVAKLKIPFGDRTEKFNALVQDLGIQKSTGYKMVKALEIVDRTALFQTLENLPPPDAILLAEAQGDVVKAVELYTDRVADNPRYSVAQFKADLSSGASSLDPPPDYCEHRDCPVCGKHMIPHIKETP